MVNQLSKNKIEIVLVSHMGHNGASGKSQMEIEIVCGPEGPEKIIIVFSQRQAGHPAKNEIEIDLNSITRNLCTAHHSRNRAHGPSPGTLGPRLGPQEPAVRVPNLIHFRSGPGSRNPNPEEH